MKGFLLAGGLGERLRPLTLRMPKCLVPVDGDPLLGVWLDLLPQHGIDEILVNVSQFPEQVEAFLAARRGGPRVTVVREAVPLGNAGTVIANRRFVENESDFWILYSDNFTTANLSRLSAWHQSHSGILTMGLFEAPDPRQAGVVTLAPDGRVLGFEEKPARPLGALANGGIYLARRELLDVIPKQADPSAVIDFGLHVFPDLVGRLYGRPIGGILIDIGTPHGLERASIARAELKRGSVAGRSN